MRRVRRILPQLAGLFLIWSASAWCIEVGQSIPEFTFQAFDGSVVSRDTLRGKPFLLVFWNTWCPVCMKDLPEVNRVHESLRPRGLSVLALNTALNDNENRARSYWEKAGYAFPGGFDRYFEIAQAFGVFAVPTFFLVDANGVVRYKQSTLPRDLEDRLGAMTRPE